MPSFADCFGDTLQRLGNLLVGYIPNAVRKQSARRLCGRRRRYASGAAGALGRRLGGALREVMVAVWRSGRKAGESWCAQRIFGALKGGVKFMDPESQRPWAQELLLVSDRGARALAQPATVVATCDENVAATSALTGIFFATCQTGATRTLSEFLVCSETTPCQVVQSCEERDVRILIRVR